MTVKQTRKCPGCGREVYFNQIDNGYVCVRDGVRWKFGNTWVKENK